MAVFIGLERIDQVLARLVEIAAAVGHTRDVRNDQTVGPVAVAVGCPVVEGILHGPDRFGTVLVLRLGTEVVVHVGFKGAAGCRHDGRVGELDDVLQILAVD